MTEKHKSDGRTTNWTISIVVVLVVYLALFEFVQIIIEYFIPYPPSWLVVSFFIIYYPVIWLIELAH